MPYDVTMVQLNASTVGGWGSGLISAPTMGFPTGNFATLLYSQWMCSPGSSLGPSGISPSFDAGYSTFVVGPSHGTITLGNVSGTFFTGSFPPFSGNLRTHLLLSIDTQTRTIQLYFNDAPVTVSGTWTGPLGSNWFNLGAGTAIFQWNGENSAITNPPAIADIWCGTSPSDTFSDLTVTANRRKFIRADLTPVYLGTDGSEAGFRPQIYCSVQSGGVPDDLLTNRGVGVNLVLGTGITLAFQAGGICALPVPPPPTGLAMDDVVAIDQTPVLVAGSQIFLDWSDDRGHSFGSPVGHGIGATGRYLTVAQWQRLGYSRDRVFRLTWSVPTATALQGAFIEVDSAKS